MGYNDGMENAKDIKGSTLRLRGKDKRVLLQVSPDGKIAVARFPDMTEKEMNSVMSICKAMMQDNTDVQMDMDKLKKFLTFESDEDEFCS